MRLLYVYRTSVGPFYIAEQAGRYVAVFNDEGLGSYARPDQAADDLANGTTFSVPGVADTSVLGIPADIGGWEPVSRAG